VGGIIAERAAHHGFTPCAILITALLLVSNVFWLLPENFIAAVFVPFIVGLSVFSTCGYSAPHQTTTRFIAVVTTLKQTDLNSPACQKKVAGRPSNSLIFTNNYSLLFTKDKNKGNT